LRTDPVEEIVRVATEVLGNEQGAAVADERAESIGLARPIATLW